MNPAQIIKEYMNVWNERDGARRRELVSAVLAPNVVYIDPVAESSGSESFDHMVEHVQKQFPTAVFSVLGEVESHHDIARFRWQAFIGNEAEPAIIGADIVAIEAGRIQTVLGFLDKVPAGV